MREMDYDYLSVMGMKNVAANRASIRYTASGASASGASSPGGGGGGEYACEPTHPIEVSRASTARVLTEQEKLDKQYAEIHGYTCVVDTYTWWRERYMASERHDAYAYSRMLDNVDENTDPAEERFLRAQREIGDARRREQIAVGKAVRRIGFACAWAASCIPVGIFWGNQYPWLSALFIGSGVLTLLVGSCIG
jgi:hypothetical protein